MKFSYLSTGCLLALFSAFYGISSARAQAGQQVRTQTQTQTQTVISPVEKRLREHVFFLASDSLGGRLIGSEGNLTAGEYIADQFADIGLEEYNGSSYFHYFEVPRPSGVEGISLGSPLEGCNIIGILPGSHSTLKNEYIVIGAHYDHLGTYNPKSEAGKGKDIIFNGADDNASGTAALIEMARSLKEKKLSRTIVFVAFDGEEQGLWGSEQFLKDSIVPPELIHLMISMDMVGHYRKTGSLKIAGTRTIMEAKNLMPVPRRIRVRTAGFELSPFTATDTKPFAEKLIPTLAVTTGLTSTYHKVSDHAETIDYTGMTHVTEYMTKVTEVFGDSRVLEASGQLSPVHNVPELTYHYGPTAALGNSRMHFTRGALEGKSGFYYNAGVTGRVLWKGLMELNGSVLFESLGMNYATATGYAFFNHMNLYALGVPVTVRVHVPGFNTLPLGVFASLTGYYRWYFASSLCSPSLSFRDDMFHHEAGMGIGLGIRTSVFQLAFEDRIGLTDLMRPHVLPGYNIKTRSYSVSFTLFF